MCTNTLSVAWDGRVYDCDFNQQLQMTMAATAAAAAAGSRSGSSERDDNQQQQKGLTVWDIGSLGDLTGTAVRVGSHCYGCTAGSGSGCQGATT
jgi:hypothetical protein